MNYCKSSMRQLRLFKDFIKNELRTELSRKLIYDSATDFEDPVDIDSDILFLQSENGIKVLNTYHSALVYSQLYKVTILNKAAILYTLSDFAQLARHPNSFVCFHDRGNIHVHI